MPSDQDVQDVKRVKRVKTPIEEVSHDAARHVGLEPERTEVAFVEIAADGQLKMTLEGPKDE